MTAGTESPRRDDRVSLLPAGTVTFLVAEVDQPAAAWPRLERVLDAVVAAHGGRLPAGGAIAGFEAVADAMAAAEALSAAVRDQVELRALAGRLRVALHTGEAQVRDDGRFAGAAVRTGERLVEIA
ncbi:MAG TPA: hypothetical protein VG411_05665, partial [Actinomycetota bacterium]|nr:hypothetical protein [Actinomycetota bacterium]